MRLALLLIVLVLGSVIGTIAYLGSQEPSNGQIFHENVEQTQVIHAPLPLPTSDQCTLSVVAGFGEVTERPWCR